MDWIHGILDVILIVCWEQQAGLVRRSRDEVRRAVRAQYNSIITRRKERAGGIDLIHMCIGKYNRS
jgi:hypothetical protein